MSERHDGPPLFALQRRERVMDELRMHGSVSVRDLADLLAVSELTIRRDINTLAGQGLVTRVHGGATLRSTIERSLGQSLERVGATSRYTIGMVVPSLDYYYPQVINGARATAAQAQCQLILRGSSYDVRDNRKQIQALLNTPGIHGLVLAPNVAGDAGAELLRWLDAQPVPVVLIERRAPEAVAARRLESVATDHAYGAGLAVRHLHAAGHERIGLLSEAESPTSIPVRRGWREAVASLGLPTDVVYDESIGFTVTDRETGLDQVIDRCEATGTTALIIHSDPEAVAFVQHCVDRGVRVPQDIAVVAYDDEVAHFAQPALTAVRPPKQAVGREAVELLIARLEGGRKRPVHHVQLNPELVVRESSVLPEAVPVE
ncbi:substrate-binding domain-containing protein [Microbacterium sp. STN6]|uniref:substrate-binding domain-containing protein n=1 Tax=Microbacterium sp. STN6 TaxID=2995588 RepID=UPI002260BB5D|nr:substrate-binding domain-containing protein [Microbacterium sp. STN6]MCX7520896.1 substrate-binding domain-containing protein [Microbacterium sp. STN6]